MADNRIAYGLAKKYGIDTKEMSPKEVWEALKGKGITQANAQEKYSAQNEKREKAEKIYNSDGIGGEHIPTEAEKKRLKELGIDEDGKEEKINNDEIKQTDKKTFHKTITKAKESNSPETRWRVDIHKEEDYGNDKLFVSKGGSCVAVEPSGNIISVCKNQTDRNIKGKDLIKHAIKNGGDRLDAFDGLYYFYIKQGFEPVSWTLFDESQAPEGWDKNRDKPEDIIFFKYTGKITKETYEEFKNRVKPSKDYPTANEIRDEDIKK